ncbi:hypothetical protein TNCV_4289621 [Trichonephila clavipes]|nr:hypothetical protein TNCV_4289621 [Trichonephila clavipes]
MSDNEQRCAIKFCFRLGHNATETFSKLQQVYEDSVLSRAQVLLRIFQFLKVADRLKASLVCKEWLQIIDCHQLLRDIKIQFSGEVDEAVKLFSPMTRQFQCFQFCRIVIDDSVIEFLEKYSNQLVTLSFIYCAVRDGKSRSKFKNLRCDNLKTLDVMNSDIASLFAILPNVTELKLRISFDLSDYVLSDLNKCLFKLETLLFYNTVSFEEEVHRRFHAVETLENHSPPQAFNFLGIKFLIEKYRTTLRDVDFTFLRLSSEALLSISEIEGLKLRKTEKLSFAYTKELQHCKAAFTPRQPASCVERLAHRRFHLGRNEVSDRLDAQRLTLTALV